MTRGNDGAPNAHLVSYLVHDLKNPIHAIDLLAQTVLRDRAVDARAYGAAIRIRDEAHVLLRMISNLLDLEQTGVHELVPIVRNCDPHTLVQELFRELRSRARMARVALAADLAVPTWSVDPDLMRRVLANLIDNAIRYSPERSWIEVAMRSVPNGVEVRVADSGPGIPMELREAVFEPFSRGGTDATRANYGLGLTFCKLAVEAHGGQIWIEDHSPGAVVCLTVPDAPVAIG